MTSGTKLPAAEDAGNGSPVQPIAGRATPEQIHDIDVAASIQGKRRGPWMVQVAHQRALEVIDAHRQQRTLEGSAA